MPSTSSATGSERARLKMVGSFIHRLEQDTHTKGEEIDTHTHTHKERGESGLERQTDAHTHKHKGEERAGCRDRLNLIPSTSSAKSSESARVEMDGGVFHRLEHAGQRQ